MGPITTDSIPTARGKMPVHKIAVIQLYAEPLAIEKNYNRACDFIREAAIQGAELAVLPEYHLNGWVPDSLQFAVQASQYKRYLDGYCALARELSINIVPGTIVEQHPSPDCLQGCPSCPSPSSSAPQLINTAYFISSEGHILGSYSKRNLWHPERPHITSPSVPPADYHPVIDSSLGKVGLLICWDLAFPEAFRELIRRGAKIIIVPACWTLDDAPTQGLLRNPNSDTLFLDSVITARTFENTCAVVFCNAGAPASHVDGEKTDYEGNSQLAVPFVGPIGKLGPEEGILLADLDMEILEEAEENYKVREDLARDDWHYGYHRKG